MTIASAATGERIEFGGVAIGEVWIAGDSRIWNFCLSTTRVRMKCIIFRKTRCCATFVTRRQVFWGSWSGTHSRMTASGGSGDSVENRDSFQRTGRAYMGHRLRAVLGVPVGFVGCNWGGTPAAAWTAAEELDAVPALQAVLDWHSRACAELDWPKYEADALHPDKDPPPEQREMLDALMMGGKPGAAAKAAPAQAAEGFSPLNPAQGRGPPHRFIREHPAPCGSLWWCGASSGIRERMTMRAAGMHFTTNP